MALLRHLCHEIRLSRVAESLDKLLAGALENSGHRRHLLDGGSGRSARGAVLIFALREQAHGRELAVFTHVRDRGAHGLVGRFAAGILAGDLDEADEVLARFVHQHRGQDRAIAVDLGRLKHREAVFFAQWPDYVQDLIEASVFVVGTALNIRGGVMQLALASAQGGGYLVDLVRHAHRQGQRRGVGLFGHISSVVD